MKKHSSRILCAVIWSALMQPVLPAFADEDSVLYTRADIISAAVGQTEFRRAYTKRLDLPGIECEQEPFSCREDNIYGQVYSLVYSVADLFLNESQRPGSDNSSAGSLMIAMEISPKEEDLFEGNVLAHLEKLRVAAYSKPQAGMGYLVDPIAQDVLVQSAHPAWVCQEQGGVYSFDLVAGKDGHAHRSFSRSGEVAEQACKAIEQAVEGSYPDIYRTLPDIRIQVRTSVHLQSVSTLEDLSWADDLAEVPESVSFTKAVLKENKTGAIRDRRGNVYRGHEGRYGDVERDVLLPPASLNLVEAPMWVARWNIKKAFEEYGDGPNITREPSASLVMAVLPVTDPLMDETGRTSAALDVPEGALVKAVIGRLKTSDALTLSLVEEAFNNPELWPDDGDWMVVACREDGTASYGIAPFSAVAEVTNPQETCAAIRREIGD